jgi:hypothetical protein
LRRRFVKQRRSSCFAGSTFGPRTAWPGRGINSPNGHWQQAKRLTLSSRTRRHNSRARHECVINHHRASQPLISFGNPCNSRR